MVAFSQIWRNAEVIFDVCVCVGGGVERAQAFTTILLFSPPPLFCVRIAKSIVVKTDSQEFVAPFVAHEATSCLSIIELSYPFSGRKGWEAYSRPFIRSNRTKGYEWVAKSPWIQILAVGGRPFTMPQTYNFRNRVFDTCIFEQWVFMAHQRYTDSRRLSLRRVSIILTEPIG